MDKPAPGHSGPNVSDLRHPAGLTAAEVEASRARHGENVLTPPPRDPWWKLLLEKFNDPIIRILLAAALIAIVAGIFNGHYEEGAGIVIAILLATSLGFFNEYKAGKEFDILGQVADDTPVRVIRDQRHQAVPRRAVVVGDAMLLEAGEEIAADAEVVDAMSFTVNESSLTGEAEPVSKKPHPKTGRAVPKSADAYPRDRVLRGTFVADGHATVVVTAVGDATEIGRTARAAMEKTGVETPLQKQLARLSRVIGACGFTVAALIFAMLLLREIMSGHFDAARPMETAATVLGYFMVAVTIIVVSIPEGLPMSVTLSLAYAMRRMAAANNLVRRMHATETIGAATVICSDKTGTLTMNEMRVAEARAPSLPAAPPRPAPGQAAHPAWSPFAMSVAVNSTANLGYDDKGNAVELLGNPTECALLLWLHRLGADYEALRRRFQVTRQLTFSTENKFMATVGRDPENPVLGAIVYAKGAPEIILERCARRRDADRRDTPLDAAARAALLEEVRVLQARGMRSLAFAERILAPDEDDKDDPLLLARGLVWVGFVAIADPVRPEVPAAMAACARAGIQVKVVTGDNQATAREIARQIGLWQPDDDESRLVAGQDFAELGDAEAAAAAARLKVMSRARPLNKQRLVSLLQKSGEVVAVTGDGTNDAPALNHADVGLSMGRTGTSVAKQASDIILLDDSFASIVNAVLWGRSLYANIQKFILFQLTINVAAVGIALLGPFLGVQLPLTVTQMLWVNLIMDTLAALAFATEPPDERVMERPPRLPNAFIVTPAMTRLIAGFGLFYLAAFLAVALGMREAFPLDAATETGRHNLSIFFSVFVFLQFWNLFNARQLGSNQSALAGLRNGRGFLLVSAVIALGQILLVQFGGAVFRTTPLGVHEWLAIFAGTSVVLWIGEIIRWRKRCRAAAAH